MTNQGEIAGTDDAKTKLKTATDETVIWAVVKQAIANLMTLKIVTEVTGGPEDEKLETCIDLFQADRTNQLHKNFLKDPDLAPLRDFHADQVRLAEEDIQRKLDFLQRMASGIVGMLSGQKKTEDTQPGQKPSGQTPPGELPPGEKQ